MQDTLESKIWKELENVMDPEIPIISVVDLGMITGIEISGDSAIVYMTPTFAGCPAVHYLQEEIRKALTGIRELEKTEVLVDFRISWNSGRITARGKQKLKEFGLAVPGVMGASPEDALRDVECPRCGGRDTRLVSPFGPTLCRALHYCNTCMEAFEQFKPL